ncbi:ribonuclease H-like domain-containing protein [Anaerocolumna aminovalerica]|uniref:ribonuclease H-like domain-containing protein n=1 Tax=Anaerocolumna aminovalerica TaxID=1527 RepID=UPI001C0EEE56|nr:ribonuclease H-like domain-containing protein [Anaerocolumna aminovalerica]MBU5334001.1 ribonuclease H-like domain-containing protein [Anaerocolumna aminovalerica]
MLTIHTTLNNTLLYPIQNPYNMEDILFFDIETTGLSAKTSFIYLVGCIYFENDTWQMIQWFADELNHEEAILHVFFKKIKHYKRLVHYNGSGFDIPFIQNKCKQYNMDIPFDLIDSFDIYKKLLPYKNLLPVQNLKLKTVESFLGIVREDTYSGADLIQVYANYLGSSRYEKLHKSILPEGADNQSPLPYSKSIPSSKDLLRILLLHNAEDLKGLLSISSILCYIDLFDNNLYKHIFQSITNTAGSQKIWNTEIISDTDSEICFLELLVTIPFKVPMPAHWENTLSVSINGICNNMSIQLIASANNVTLKIPVFKGKLKYFFNNYKDYYYLPKEDMAIHKSVAQFVDKEYRIQAKANTCYNKKTGIFIPAFGKLSKNVFKAKYQDHISFIELDISELKESAELYECFMDYINFLCHSKETKLKLTH